MLTHPAGDRTFDPPYCPVMKLLLNQRVPSYDGVELSTDVYLPGPGRYPIVLTRTPYAKGEMLGRAQLFHERGMGYAMQDVRGKYDSDGRFEPLVDEAADGQATIDWIANQSWCNGHIGMWGPSYLGIVQAPAAAGGHEALKAICPSVAPGSFFNDWLRYDGCFAWANNVWWSMEHATCRTRPARHHWDKNVLWGHRRIEDLEQYTGLRAGFLRLWALHDTDGGYWRNLDQRLMHRRLRTAGFHVGGWFDHLSRGQFDAYRNLQQEGQTDLARLHQRLLIGPWGHLNLHRTNETQQSYGSWNFGAAASFNVMQRELQFLQFHLCGIDDHYLEQPRVQCFLMGRNQWLDLPDWPAPSAQPVQWHLASDGHAATAAGSGRLQRETPAASSADEFTHDPANPVPTTGGPIYWNLDPYGPVNIDALGQRGDCLWYRSEPLSQPLVLVGEPTLDLHVQTDADDTDFIARLCVQQPDGQTIILTLGSLRCRYRHSFERPEPMPARTPQRLTVRLQPTAYEFPVGSRVCLVLSSSDWPRILPHNGKMSLFAPADPARNSVLTGPGTLSSLTLPTLENA